MRRRVYVMEEVKRRGEAARVREVTALYLFAAR